MRLSLYLSEAPIRIDLGALKNKLNKVFEKPYRSAGTLINNLNKEFKVNDIAFVVSTEPDEVDVINAHIYPDDLLINVIIGKNLLFLKPSGLVKKLIEALEHELIHREQLIRADGKLQGCKLASIDADNIDQYLSDKQEIMAYAAEIVTSFRNKGYKDNQIIDMLRSPKKWLTKTVKSRGHLEMYMDVFEKDSPVIKRLKKQIIRYLEK